MASEEALSGNGERIRTAIADALPGFRLEKPAGRAAVARLVELLEDDPEILAVRVARIVPSRFRGTGLLLLTNRSVLIADVHPAGPDRTHRISASEIRAVGTRAASFGSVQLAVVAQGETVEVATNQDDAEALVELVHTIAPHTRDAATADAVESWLEDPGISWPRKGTLGNRWEYLGVSMIARRARWGSSLI